MSTMCRRLDSVPSDPRTAFHDVVASDARSIKIRTDELRTVREAMRDLGSMLSELDGGDVEKFVLTQRNRMRAVVVSVERWSEMEQAIATSADPPATPA
jgi:hypothetical protein